MADNAMILRAKMRCYHKEVVSNLRRGNLGRAQELLDRWCECLDKLLNLED